MSKSESKLKENSENDCIKGKLNKHDITILKSKKHGGVTEMTEYISIISFYFEI